MHAERFTRHKMQNRADRAWYPGLPLTKRCP
jgi:hypothetical protein